MITDTIGCVIGLIGLGWFFDQETVLQHANAAGAAAPCGIRSSELSCIVLRLIFSVVGREPESQRRQTRQKQQGQSGEPV
jgi:hypothetical protein